MKGFLKITFGLTVCLGATQASYAGFFHNSLFQYMVWRKAPLNITLPVGHERMISFPGSVKFGYDQGVLPQSVLHVVNNNQTLYLTASKAFKAQPVRVLLVKSGKIILMNLTAKQGVSDTPVDVVLPVPSTSVKAQNDMQSGAVNYGGLIRFAANQLYAPARLLTQPGNIFRTPMETRQSVPLLLDGSVLANPLISWREHSAYITAVQVYNNEKFAVNLDPSAFCGQWKMAAFYPRKTIQKQSSDTDNTTVFLVSDQPFGQAISQCEGGY